jgi:hypothetical protein
MANPIFIAARLNTLTASLLREAVLADFVGKIPLSNIVPTEDYHTTLLYDKQGCINDMIPYSELLMDTPNLVAMGFEYRYFNNGIMALVLVSNGLRALNKEFYKYALTRSAFPSYVPHITIATNIETTIPSQRSFINIPIYYDYIYSEPIK